MRVAKSPQWKLRRNNQRPRANTHGVEVKGRFQRRGNGDRHEVLVLMCYRRPVRPGDTRERN